MSVILHLGAEVPRIDDASNLEDETSEQTDPREESSVTTFANCFGLPYQDHNYGAPPPPTPPLSPQILHKVEDEFACDPFEITAVTTIEIGNDPEDAIDVTIKDEKKTIAKYNKDDWGDSITRCICEMNHNDEYMICCDRCLVWQHVDCMGLERNKMPETYMCERCDPRFVDKQRAIALQLKKKEDGLETDSSCATDTEEDDGLNKSKKIKKAKTRRKTKLSKQEKKTKLERKSKKENFSLDGKKKKQQKDIAGTPVSHTMPV